MTSVEIHPHGGRLRGPSGPTVADGRRPSCRTGRGICETSACHGPSPPGSSALGHGLRPSRAERTATRTTLAGREVRPDEGVGKPLPAPSPFSPLKPSVGDSVGAAAAVVGRQAAARSRATRRRERPRSRCRQALAERCGTSTRLALELLQHDRRQRVDDGVAFVVDAEQWADTPGHAGRRAGESTSATADAAVTAGSLASDRGLERHQPSIILPAGVRLRARQFRARPGERGRPPPGPLRNSRAPPRTRRVTPPHGEPEWRLRHHRPHHRQTDRPAAARKKRVSDVAIPSSAQPGRRLAPR